MEVARSVVAPAQPGRLSFVQKPVVAAGLIALADLVFFEQPTGATIGVFALTLLAFALAAQPQALRVRGSALAALCAFMMALVLIERPGPLSIALFWLAATMAMLLPRSAAFDDGWRWARRLLVHATRSSLRPLADLIRLRRAAKRRPAGVARRFPMLVLPVSGTILFLTLFAQANPLIGDALGGIDLLTSLQDLSPSRVLFWLMLLVPIWSLLRPSPKVLAPGRTGEVDLNLPGVSVGSVTLSLAAFNFVFAVANGLDLIFLWSGAPLPHGMTLADYAHRGAYPLIATALLSGLFVLLTLQPGSAMAEYRLIRRLVFVWIGQNVFLVASTILRTADYVEAYSLTRLRIAALIWMALVAVGLVLICIWVWRRKSGGWLINANLAAALSVLAACSAIDLGSIAAHWNVRNAREAGGAGANLDVGYLRQLGPAALTAAVQLESRIANPELKAQLASVRIAALRQLEADQANWRSWTFRGERRLDAAKRMIVEHRLPQSILPPPRVNAPHRAPPILTAAPRR